MVLTSVGHIRSWNPSWIAPSAPSDAPERQQALFAIYRPDLSTEQVAEAEGDRFSPRAPSDEEWLPERPLQLPLG